MRFVVFRAERTLFATSSAVVLDALLPDRERIRASTSDAQKIDELYQRIGSYRRMNPTAMDDLADHPRLSEWLTELRALQTREAERLVERFRQRLDVAPGEGYQAIDSARRLLEQYEG